MGILRIDVMWFCVCMIFVDHVNQLLIHLLKKGVSKENARICFAERDQNPIGLTKEPVLTNSADFNFVRQDSILRTDLTNHNVRKSSALSKIAEPMVSIHTEPLDFVVSNKFIK